LFDVSGEGMKEEVEYAVGNTFHSCRSCADVSGEGMKEEEVYQDIVYTYKYTKDLMDDFR
jgi:hypothetical protein